MKRLILLSVVLLTGCRDETVYSIDPKLQPYLDSFYAEAEARGRNFSRDNLVLKLVTDLRKNTGAWARCRREIRSMDGNQRTIELDEGYYNKYHTQWIQKETGLSNCIEALLFHEFGHGFLDREHSESSQSIMNVMESTCCFKWGQARESMVDELFL